MESVHGIEPLLTTADVAKILGTTVLSMSEARRQGRGIGHDLPYIKIGHQLRFRPETVRAYLAEKEVRVAA